MSRYIISMRPITSLILWISLLLLDIWLFTFSGYCVYCYLSLFFFLNIWLFTFNGYCVYCNLWIGDLFHGKIIFAIFKIIIFKALELCFFNDKTD